MPTAAFSPDCPPPELSPIYRAAADDRLRALTTLAGGLAHNLRSPLTAIMGRAELVAMRQPGLSEDMHDIVAQCEAINALLKGLVSKLELEGEPGPWPVDLNELVERECDFLSFDRRFKHEVRKEFTLADKLPAVTVVYGAIARAFAAVIDNALIALRGMDEPQIAIATEAVEGAVRLSVRDSGCGIPPKNLAHVFEPGFTTRQGDGFGTEPVEDTGRGYGLAFTAAVAHDCGGAVEVSSEPGAGTVVTITLPV